MDEMMVRGWFYLPTTATTTDEAYADFVHRCRIIGMNPDNIEQIIVRDSDGDDLTSMRYFDEVR